MPNKKAQLEKKQKNYKGLFEIGNEAAAKYKRADVGLMQERLINYFAECDADKRPYTTTGIANALYISKDAMCEYGKKDPFAPLIKAAKQKVEQQIEENGLTGRGNAAFSIFNLKNNYGWKDSQEITTHNEIENLNTLADVLGFKKD